MKAPTLNSNRLTHDDLVWFYSATEFALGQMKDIKKKKPAEVDGEAFTSMRRLATETGSLTIKQLFRGSMKHFPYRLDARITGQEKEVLVIMFDKLKARRMEDKESPVDMRELELMVLAAQATVREAARIASESTKVKEGLDGIQDILDGKQD